MAMRVATWALLGACSAAPALADEPFPYTAYVNAADVYVRSGPGENYYPVLKLQRGDLVEVYRHDPGGWYAIRPPDGCFTWVSAEFLEPRADNLALVTGDRVVARVGSAFSDIRDVIQVRLDRGEVVEVLEARRFGSGPAAKTWYKIAPPSGEFRWIWGRLVDRELSEPEPSKPGPHNNLLLAGHSPQPDADTLSADATAAGTDATKTVEPAGPNDEAQEAPPNRQPRAVRSSPPEHDGAADRAHHKGRSRADLTAELEEIDLELSVMVAEEPTVWDFRQLEARAEAVLAGAETALARGRARRLLHKLARFSDIHERYEEVLSLRAETDRRDRQLSALARAAGRTAASYEKGPRFDGLGKLTEVVSGQLGAPRYALLDEEGEVRFYVTPAPGVNLRRYLGHEVGVNGTLGYLADHRAQHVTAKQVQRVDDRVLR